MSMSGLMVNLKAQDLGGSSFQLGLLGVAWAIPYALLCPMAGSAAGRLDRRLILVVGGLLVSLSPALQGSVSTPEALILVAPFAGLGCALFWPAFETLLHTVDPAETQSRLGTFNIGWTVGILGGSAVAGYLYDFAGTRWSFWATALLVLGTSAYIAYRTRGGAIGHAPGPEAPPAPREGGLSVSRRAGYMKLAWIANFTIWFAGAAVGTIFPKLARSLGVSVGSVGLLMAVVMVAQAASFAALSRTSRWHYRLLPMLGSQALAAAGLLAIAHGSAAWAFAAGLALIGLARGGSYSASLYYGLDSEAARGLNAGIHEAVIGVAYVAGPFVSGLVAQQAGLRAPFTTAAAVVLCGLALEVALWRRLDPYQRPPEPVSEAGRAR